MTKRLTATGLRALIREVTAETRGRSRLREGASSWSFEVTEAIEDLASAIAEEMVSQGVATDSDADEIRSSAVNELGQTVGAIMDTWTESH